MNAETENHTMTRIALIALVLLGGIANAFGESYTDVKRRDIPTFLSEYPAAVASCSQINTKQTGPAYRKCMLSLGFKWQAYTVPISPLGIDPITQSAIDAGNQQ
jgi:hypothetical protein